MAFNPLKEKGTPLDHQLRNWNRIVHKPYDKKMVDAYSRSRQILINGVEMEAWIFNHSFARQIDNDELKITLAQIRHVEDQQETTINWLTPGDQTILETTLAYEQVATDLTAYLAQNEPDENVRRAFDFGLLEDFDHLYRYSQLYQMMEGRDPDEILQGRTDVFPGRPTQDHHNNSAVRLRHHYDRHSASPRTKVNVLTLLAGEQQTHNFYKAHGFMYAAPALRKLYAEIADVEEEHVTQYESLIDPNETMLEKWLMHEFMEVCNYYTFLQQEPDERLRRIYEEFLSYELEHLRIAGALMQKYENRDPESVIGSEVVMPSRFDSQKGYVAKVLREQVDLRLTADKGYSRASELPADWPSYPHQERMNAEGTPSEEAVRMQCAVQGRDFVRADQSLINEEEEIVARGLGEHKAPQTVEPRELVGAGR